MIRLRLVSWLRIPHPTHCLFYLLRMTARCILSTQDTSYFALQSVLPWSTCSLIVARTSWRWQCSNLLSLMMMGVMPYLIAYLIIKFFLYFVFGCFQLLMAYYSQYLLFEFKISIINYIQIRFMNYIIPNRKFMMICMYYVYL